MSPGKRSLQVPPPVVPRLGPEAVSLQAPTVFSDVGPDHWVRPFLDDLSARGWVAGLPDKSFRPERPITRAELAVQLATVFQLPQQRGLTFSDVPPDHWAYDSIQQAAQMGFLRGYPPAQFRPARTVSRAEVLVAIATGLELPPPTAPPNRLHQFQDYAAIPAWAAPSIAAAAQAHIIVNHPDPGRLAPCRPATRAEAVAILHRALVYLGELGDWSSPYGVPASP